MNVTEYKTEVEYPSVFVWELMSYMIKNSDIFVDFLFHFVYVIFESKFVF